MKKKRQIQNLRTHRGITIIALIITIIVLLILAAISITALFGEDGLITRAQRAKTKTEEGADKDGEEIEGLNSKINEIVNGEKGPKIKLSNGKTVTLTKETYGDYLGRKVTNYKEEGTGTEKVKVGENEYIVSTTYRLYYVDFGNKFGEGEGTVYLKADYTNNGYALQLNGAEETSKIQQLNPALYKEGVTTPGKGSSGMRAVTWLTDTKKWEGLVKSSLGTKIADSINYIVGAPSLEMMIDSYNAHYKLEGDKPDYSAITLGGARRKLFYQYPLTGNTNNYGYGVGPSDSKEYGHLTLNNIIQTDSKIDSMYYPGDNKQYWLASPSANQEYCVMLVNESRVDYNGCTVAYTLCPLVSLKSNVQLELAD